MNHKSILDDKMNKISQNQIIYNHESLKVDFNKKILKMFILLSFKLL